MTYKIDTITLNSIYQTLEEAGNKIFGQGKQLPNDIMKAKIIMAMCLIKDIERKK